ncbi:hypothetical protein SLEP1_g30369 [Rubroshorea leprosula]|uniref:Uncharacterized protein n=1 Tax=Rubroshorea leprosula TaxID=152421 RepID=A0AAV5K5J5_9ROSI|nr:hypothetical protein SLEP1_g30369 [Rubroshorea leprosula]
MSSCIPFLGESLDFWSNMKCDVVELLIFKATLDLVNPLLVKAFSMDEYFNGVLTYEESCLTMYESISQLLKAENQTRLWECKKRNKHGCQIIDEG